MNDSQHLHEMEILSPNLYLFIFLVEVCVFSKKIFFLILKFQTYYPLVPFSYFVCNYC